MPYVNARLPVHPYVSGPGTPNGMFPMPQQSEERLRTPDHELHTVKVGGLNVGFKGHIPGGKHVLGTSATGRLPRRDSCGPPPPEQATPPRFAAEIHRKAFKQARFVGQQEATLRQHRLNGINRWAPFGVDTDPGPTPSSRSDVTDTHAQQHYLSVPEEAHYLWDHTTAHGAWGGYSDVGEKLRNTRRPHSVGPHARLVRSHQAARARGEFLEPQHPPNPVHHLALLSNSDHEHSHDAREDGFSSHRSSSRPESARAASRGDKFRLGDSSGRATPRSARGYATGVGAPAAWPEESPRRFWKRGDGTAYSELGTRTIITEVPRAVTNTDIWKRSPQQPMPRHEASSLSSLSRLKPRAAIGNTQPRRGSTAIMAMGMPAAELMA